LATTTKSECPEPCGVAAAPVSLRDVPRGI
jgi:hypothetical protein